MAHNGIDVRATGDRLIFRVSLKDSAGAKVTTGTTSLRLYKLVTGGTLETYDFSDNTFKTGTVTTETLALTHRTANNGATNTGLWTAILTTLTGFVSKDTIIAQVTNSSAVPESQEREFQFGGGQGDHAVDASGRGDLGLWLGTAPLALVSQRVNVSVGALAAAVFSSAAWAANAITAAALDPDVTTELQTGLATAAALTTVDDFLDTEIADIQARLPAALVSGRIDASVGAMAANVMTAAAANADLTTELQAGLATAAALTTVSGLVDDLEGRLTSGRATNLDNLDAAITSRLAPTVAARTLDVSAGGEAGVDWANVGSPTTAVNLSGTNIKTDQVIASVSGAVGSVTGSVGGSVASVAAGGIASTSFATGAVTADAIAADAGAEIGAAVINSTQTIAELAAVPGATPTLKEALMWLYQAARNNLTSTSTQQKVRKDDGTVVGTATVSDDGATFTRGKFG